MKSTEAVGILVGMIGIYFLHTTYKHCEIISPNGTDCTIFIMIVVFVTFFASGFIIGNEFE